MAQRIWRFIVFQIETFNNHKMIRLIPRGNCATWISGNAPPSPKSLTVLGTNPDRAPYGGGSLLTVATAWNYNDYFISICVKIITVEWPDFLSEVSSWNGCWVGSGRSDLNPAAIADISEFWVVRINKTCFCWRGRMVKMILGSVFELDFWIRFHIFW